VLESPHGNGQDRV